MLEFDNVSVGYGQTVVVHNATMTMAPAGITTLLGHNGAGKTTLLRAAMGLLRPAAGRILLDGEDVTALPPHQRVRRGLSFVPQGQLSFPELTTLENLLVSCGRRHHGRIDDALDLFPALRELLDRPAGLLSGGQRQQLAIARALLREPSTLLMDEPTEGIQPSIVSEIEQTILRLVRDRDVSVLLVEQQVGFGLDHAEMYAVMESGRLGHGGEGGGKARERAREALKL